MHSVGIAVRTFRTLLRGEGFLCVRVDTSVNYRSFASFLFDREVHLLVYRAVNCEIAPQLGALIRREEDLRYEES